LIGWKDGVRKLCVSFRFQAKIALNRQPLSSLRRPADCRLGDAEFDGNRYAAASQLFYRPIFIHRLSNAHEFFAMI
jgi:hypothetical protein